MKLTKEEVQESKSTLLKLLKNNRRIYQTVTHVSRSGMSRNIKNWVIGKDYNKKPCIISIDYYLARVLGYPLTKGDGIKVGGCGMDMGFHVAYSLGRRLFPNGDGRTVTNRNGDTKPETDGGYLIRQEWI